ncbi:MAG: cell division protein ZapA [Marinifilaceae bacterium]|jgi:cell division protein ZapA (FtsZ GTPase activity inhibitor)|nr:cell division protein ZapA [Marinilabiliaceae bacterium JC040]MCT4599376.1 cell division protein ZapA [Marinifilaceae bacterium]
MGNKLKNKEFQINVDVAGRIFKIFVDRDNEEEEEFTRLSAKKINEEIEKLREEYNNSTDSYNFLAMASLNIVKKLLAEQRNNNHESFIEDVKDLNEEIKDIIE